MAQSANGNVVPLGDHPRARTRLTRAESADVLSACRQLALERMSRSLSGMLDRLEDDLLELAEKAPERDAQNTYLDARTQAREKRPAIEANFRRHFIELFDRRVSGGSAPAASAAATSELALVEPEDLEERLAVREMSRKLGAACEGELFALSQRMGFLLERPELDDEANPLSPSMVCAALKDACDQIGAGFKVRLMMLRRLERHAEAELQALYRDVNTDLVERRILPEVRHGVRRSAIPPARAGAAPAAAAPADIFGALAQLLGAATPGSTGPAAAPGFGANAPGQPLDAASASFLTELTRMHREAGGGADATDAPVNIVKSIGAAPRRTALGTVDAMTIDIVSMLFDYIFEDRHIATTVKVWLGRLQIPTLKAALLDRNFFSSKAHPARRLIDRLAECAIGLDEANADGSGCIALIESVVHRILADFDTDLAVFESQLARVEGFIDERKRAEAEVVERSARLVEARERAQTARACAEDEVERCLQASPWVPRVVREMLEETWVRALAAARSDEGEESASWRMLLGTMEDLAWSVEPKAQPEDRKRLVALLPALLKNLLEGMRRGGMDMAGRSAFLGALVDCHAAAVKSGLRGLAALPEAAAPAPDPQPAIARELVPDGDIRMEEIRLRAQRRRGAAHNVFTRTGVWTNLQRGTWVEFAGPAASMRARLTWISPDKGVYLFTNPLSAGAAVSISPEALAEQMRLGEARMLDDAPLMDRAVGSMLADLQNGGGPAQG